MKAERLITVGRRFLVTLMLAAPLAACGGGDEQEEIPAIVRDQRVTAYRQACAAKELEQSADENLALLETAWEGADENEALAATRNAAAGFARGYFRHAEFRHALYAMVDSAYNHASTSADSLRFEERASAFSVRAPAPGTVEANAMQSYENDLARILSDEDHPCNWNIPGMTEAL